MNSRQSRTYTRAMALSFVVLLGLVGCTVSADSTLGPTAEVGEGALDESRADETRPGDGVVGDTLPQDTATGNMFDDAVGMMREPEDDAAGTFSPQVPVLARDVTITDGGASLDLGGKGIPVIATDISADSGYVIVPNSVGHYYFFVGETLHNSDGGVNWFVNVPPEAEPKLWDHDGFHMIDADGVYTEKAVLWSYADEDGVTYLIYDPELGPACQGDCADIAGTDAGRFVAIAAGN